jgi:hypothetical protein
LGVVEVDLGVAGAGDGQQGVEGLAAGEGVVDDGDQGGPPRAGSHRRCTLRADGVGEVVDPHR